MAFYNGKYRRWEDWQPTYISGCTMWLDAVDTKYVIEKTGVSLWVDKNYDSTLNFKRSSGDGTGGGTAPLEYPSGFTGVYQPAGVAESVELSNGNWYLNITGSLGGIQKTNLPLGVEKVTIKLKRLSGTVSLYVYEGFESNWSEIVVPENNVFYTVEIILNRIGGAFILSPIFAGGGEFEIESIVIEKLIGNHFTQSSSSSQPTYSANTITFNGSTDFLDGSANIGNFSGDSQGELISVFKRVATGSQTYVLSYGTSTTNGNALLFDHAGTGAVTLPNDIRIYSHDGSVNAVGSDSSDTDNKIISWSSNGSTWRIFRDNGELTNLNVDGSNNGNWFSDISIGDGLLIGKWAGSSAGHGNVQISEFIYYNRQLTDKERNAVFYYLNNKHSIY